MNIFSSTLQREFIWRRLHSLMGLWLVLFLMEHLLVNSQAALLLGDNGRGFVDLVNGIHNLPYLQVIELTLLGVPIFIHMVWGIKYLFTAKINSTSSDGSKPSLKEYGRNHAYTWQRITSWILVFGIIGHVAKFRFLEYPDSVQQGGKEQYLAVISVDNGLYTVADRLNVKLFDTNAVAKEKESVNRFSSENIYNDETDLIKNEGEYSFVRGIYTSYDESKAQLLTNAQKFHVKKDFLDALLKQKLKKDEVIAVTDSFGTASLLLVRDTFKSPLYVGLYTIFVLAACFHAFNGFWTFLITWGVVLRMAAQKAMVNFAIGLMVLISFLGLAAIWGTYFLNLKS